MTLLSSAPLANYLNFFRADAAQGRLLVPVLEVSPGSPFGTVASQPLDLTNMDKFTHLSVSYVQQRLEGLIGNDDDNWTLHEIGPPTTLFVNSREGRSVTLDSKGDTTLRINGTRHGLAVEVSSFGNSSRVSLGNGIELRSPHFAPHALYTIEFVGPGVMGLREFLGVTRRIPVMEVALALYNQLDLQEAPPLVGEFSSLEKDGSSHVTVHSGFSHTMLAALGTFSETVKVTIRPSDFYNSALSPQLLQIWDLAIRLGSEDNPSTIPLQKPRPLN